MHNPVKLKTTIEWYQGWACDEIRDKSSSGGFASAIMREFVINGGTVVACRFANGEFRFAHANNVHELQGFAGSKYVKSNPEGLYRTVHRELQEEKRILFIGLPCQIAGLRNYLGEYPSNLYTIDLICHGTPSIKILQRVLKERNIDISELKTIAFRKNTNFGLYVDGRRISPDGTIDSYTIGFLNALFYTDNCYQCPYATGKRVADLTLGDAWGSHYHIEEAKGISLALVQTKKGSSLIRMPGLELKEIDYNNAVMNNKQLQRPSIPPKQRTSFFRWMNRIGVRYAVIISYPFTSLKQRVKALLRR